MTWSLLLRIAWRNLWRHPRRTALTALAFAIGVFLLVVFLGLGDGMHEKMIDTGIRLGSGHVVIEARGARERVGTNVLLPDDAVAAVRAALAEPAVEERVRGTAPRLLASGLLSSAANSTGVQVVGTEAARERDLSLLPARLVAGTYLGADGATPPVVIGRALADKLKVGLDSKVVLMVQAGAEIQSQLLRVRGIFATGMDDADGHLIVVPLADLQALLARPGALSHEAVFLQRADDAERVRGLIAAGLRERPVSVLTWREAMPQLDEFIAIDDASNWIFNAIVLVMVALGVLNTVLMAVLERRREFGLLGALGMRPWQIATMTVAESLFLTALGGLTGGSAGWALHRYFAVHGVDMTGFGGGEFHVAGVAVDAVVHSYLYPGRLRTTALFVAALGLLAGLYPALRAARTRPIEVTRA